MRAAAVDVTVVTTAVDGPHVTHNEGHEVKDHRAHAADQQEAVGADRSGDEPYQCLREGHGGEREEVVDGGDPRQLVAGHPALEG